MSEKRPTREEIAEENRKIRRLRFMVDFSISLIRQGNLSREEAFRIFIGVKNLALELFPGKEEVFEIVYSPRFRRAIAERYGVH